jgi:hypothetical protein
LVHLPALVFQSNLYILLFRPYLAKEKVEKYFEDPSNELAKKGFEGAKNWAVENDIKEVLKQIKTYEEAFENMQAPNPR